MEDESNTMRLGSPFHQTQTFVAGVADTPVTGSTVFITPNGQLGVQVSSARYKQDIAPLGQLSEPLHQLRPVTFHYRQEPQGPRQYGLIAEEVATVYPELVTRDTHGEVQGVRYEALIPLLLNELQHQHRQLSTQADQIDTQARQMSAVFEQLAELQSAERELTGGAGTPAARGGRQVRPYRL